jgi:hypothetical protein
MLLICFCLQSFTQYIPLSVYELESWLGNPSIYVFDCSAAGMIVNAFCEVPVIILLFRCLPVSFEYQNTTEIVVLCGIRDACLHLANFLLLLFSPMGSG